jgi:hypothetical protein
MSQKFKSEVELQALNNATTDTDRFLVSDSGVVKYRTGSQILSDLGVSGIYVPYTGATGNVDLGTHTLSSYNLIVNHTSGSGVAASITKGGNGEALTINKTSGSGNAMSVSGGLTSLVDLTLSSIPNATIDTDRFIVSDSGAIKYRTGTQLLSDIGGQVALTNPVTGTGTLNFVSKFTSTGSTLGDSQIFDNGTNVGIGTVSPSAKLDIRAQGALSSDLTFVVKNSADTVKLIEANGAGGIDIRSTPGNRLTLSNTVETSFDITDTGGHSKRFFLRNSDKTLGIYNNDAGQQRTQLRLVTGAAASSDRLSLLEAGGNVGIGTTTPSYKLDINLGTVSANTNIGYNIFGDATVNPGYAGYNLQLNNSSANASGYLRLARTPATAYLGLEMASQSRDGIRFLTHATTPVEVMRITNTGNVGIGNTTPTALGTNITTLDIKGSIGGGVRSGVLGGSESTFYTIAAGGYLGTISNIPLYFQTNNSVKATILANGNVGIGTTIPDQKLQVNGANQTYIKVSSTDTNSVSGFNLVNNSRSWILRVDGTDGNKFQIRDATANAQRLTIDASGNVGIGTTSPAVRLNVVGGDAAFDFGGFANVPAVKLLRAGDEPTLRFYRPSGGTPDARIFQIQNTVGDLTFGYALANKYSESTFTEAMRITSISNVGIGVTNPVDKLDVNGAIRFRVNTSSFTGAIDSGLIDFVPTSVFPTDPQVRLAAIGTATVGASIAFQTGVNSGSVTERMRITSAGNVGIGTSSPDGTVPMTINANNNSYYSTLLLTNSNTGTEALSQLQLRTANQPLSPLVIHQFNSGGNAQITNVANSYLQLGTNNTVRLTITSGGAMGLGVIPTNTLGRFEASNDIVAYSSSDKRWKTNIKNIDSPLDKISQINGVEFDWIEDEPIHGNKGHDIGVIAQEVEQILPGIVQTRESGMKAVQYDKIIPLLIESIKEQQKQIEELKQILNGITN